MTRNYRMVLHSSLGPREGMLTLEEDGSGAITGRLCILGRTLAVSGRREADGRLSLVHRIVTAVSEYPCQSLLREEGDALTGELRMDQSGALWRRDGHPARAVMAWSGERLKETEAEHI